jgi:hypothetical protein
MGSYRAFSGYSDSPEWLRTHRLLSLFGEDRAIAKQGYRDFVESIENEKIANPSDDVVSGVVLGGVDFVNWVKKTFLNKGSNSKDIPQLKSLKSRPTPEELFPAISDEFGCEIETILQKGKKRNLARDVAIYLSREMTGKTSVALGRGFGISGAGIGGRHNQIAKQSATERKLKERIDRIKRRIIDI